jgi:TRAP-type C4-dicarboxylate transport system substrate-binding protein
MLEINWAPIVGALVVTKKAWDEMSPAGQAALREAGEKAGLQMRTQARKEVDEAVRDEEARPAVHRPNAEQLREWHELAEQAVPAHPRHMVPAETFDEVFAHLKAYRARPGNAGAV